MRFLLIRRADEATEANTLPSQELFDSMAAYNQRLMEAGAWVDGMGLASTGRGALVSFREGRPTVIDGPFAEAKELIAGFTIIEVASREDAVAWARQWPVEDADGNVTIEVRQVLTAEDFEGLTAQIAGEAD